MAHWNRGRSLRFGRKSAAVLLIACVAGAAGAAGGGPARAAAAGSASAVRAAAGFRDGGSGNWPAYLNGPAHWSYSPNQRAITPADVGRLRVRWRFRGRVRVRRGQPRPGFLASPVVVGGAIYIGADTGWFYKISVRTGAVLARRFIGYQPPKTCAPRGFVATATVAVDRATGIRTVYVDAADGYLYALRATNLSPLWRSLIARPSRTVSDYFQWSSPTVAGGRIYVGVSSNCDHPLVPGGLVSFDQATGARLASFTTLPPGILGGSVWSSAAVGPTGDVYVTTGNPAPGTFEPAYSDSIVRLDPQTLRPLAAFAVPSAQVIRDGDFGASATMFGRYVGACDKNGIFYALTDVTLRLVWSRRVGARAGNGVSTCAAAAVYDGRSLYLSGDGITIRGRRYRGSIQRVDPATGGLIWATGLPNGVIGTPTLDGAGVLAVGTYDYSHTPNAIYLVDAATGRILRTLSRGSENFAQAVFADGELFTANGTGLTAWGLRSRRAGRPGRTGPGRAGR